MEKEIAKARKAFDDKEISKTEILAEGDNA